MTFPELDTMQEYMDLSQLPHRITSAFRNPRYPGDKSLHTVGRALDVAGPTPWYMQKRSPALFNIWHWWFEQKDSLYELIYSGAPFYISRGVVKESKYMGNGLRDAHWNHVHIAVPEGWHYEIIQEANMPDNVHPAEGKIVNLVPTMDDGGYWVITEKGEVFAFGNAKYYGRAKYTP